MVGWNPNPPSEVLENVVFEAILLYLPSHVSATMLYIVFWIAHVSTWKLQI